MDVCHIDIETFSEENLKASGVYRYAEHPSTEILVLCYKFGFDGPVHVWVPRDDVPRDAMPLKRKMDKGGKIYVQTDMPDDLSEFILEGGELRAWNAMFERVVLGELGRTGRIDWPEVPREQWMCNMAKAAAHALRMALGWAAKDCGTYLKDDTGKMVMLQLCKPRRPSIKNPATRWTIEDVPDKYRSLYHYCIDDVRAETDLDQYIPELSPGEVKAYHLDQLINDRGIAIDMPNVLNAQKLVNEYKERLADSCIFKTGVRPGQTAALAEWIREQGYDIENLQKATIIEAVKDPDIPESVAKILKLYSTYNMKAVSKFPAMENAVCEDMRLRGMFRYHSATTGRWSSVIVQLQNLFRSIIGDEDMPGAWEEFAIDNFGAGFEWFHGLFDKNPMKVLASCVRGMLVGGPGKKLLAIDYAAIEARVIAWLAGQDDILAVFSGHGKIYEYTAAKIFRVKVEDVTKAQRFIGKIAVLALGYQGGKKAFANMASQYGVDFPEDEAEKVKRDWRAANPMIVDLWYAMERAASAAIGNPGSIYSVNGKILFKVEGDWLYMRLPSGRRIAYFKPQLDNEGKPTFMGVDTYTRQWGRCKTYGGKLTENAVQAIARDLLLFAMFNLDPVYPLVGTVHDEVICEIDDDLDEEETLAHAADIMCILPKWAEGLPVRAEGFISKRYRK